jgi:hypothetical protein
VNEPARAALRAAIHETGYLSFDVDATRWEAFSENPTAPSRPSVHGERGESTGSTTRTPTLDRRS